MHQKSSDKKGGVTVLCQNSMLNWGKALLRYLIRNAKGIYSIQMMTTRVIYICEPTQFRVV